MRHIFSNCFAKFRIRRRLEGMRAADVSVHDVAAGKVVGLSATVQREIGDGEIVADPAANLEPLRVHGGHGTHVHQVDLLHELVNLGEQRADRLEAVHAESRLAVEIDGVGDSAHGEGLDVRRFRSEDAHDLQSLALVFQCLQIVGEGEQVDFGRQPHRRMSPVAVGEDSELSASGHGLHLVLRGFEFIARIAGPGRQALRELRSRGWVGLRDCSTSTQSSAESW